MGHSPRLTHHHKKRGCTSTSLYTYPTASDTVPVYETLSLEWATDCSSLSGQVDIYLSVLEDTGYLAVREWTGATYSSGKLETQLQPGWWNASTGAGSVSAQVRPDFLPSVAPLRASRQPPSRSRGAFDLPVQWEFDEVRAG